MTVSLRVLAGFGGNGCLMSASETPRSDAKSILLLAGHLVGSAFIFATFFTMQWLMWLGFDQLDRMHPLPETIRLLVSKLEIVILYADAIVTGIVVIAAMYRFCREVTV